MGIVTAMFFCVLLDRQSLPLEEVVLGLADAAAVHSLCLTPFYNCFSIKRYISFESLGSAGLCGWGQKPELLDLCHVT